MASDDITYTYLPNGYRYIPGYNDFKSEYLNEYAYKHKLPSNRVFESKLKLPYTGNELKVKFNEYVDYSTINSLIDKLYTNFVYVLSQCKTYHIDGIYNYRGSSAFVLESYEQTVVGKYKTDYTHLAQPNMFNELDVRSMVLTDHRNTGMYSLILATKDRLILNKFEPIHLPGQSHKITTVSTSASEMFIDSDNDLKFKEIKKIVTNDKGYLFTLDTGRNIIYKHNIRGLTNDDDILLRKQTTGRLLDTMMGTNGDIDSKIQFNNPIDMIYNSGLLYVLDKDVRNYQIKVYDDQLNWVASYNISLDFVRNNPKSFAANDGYLYILTDEGLCYIYSINELATGNLQADRQVNMNIVDKDYNKTEKYLGLQFSHTNTNVCYVVTNRSIYKKTIDQLDLTAGKIDWAKHSIAHGDVNPILSTSMASNTLPEDLVIVYGASYSTQNATGQRLRDNILLYFRDKDPQLELLAEDWEQYVLKLEDIHIKPNEYVSAFVYNKMVVKLLNNINIIYNSIVSVPTAETNDIGQSIYRGIRYVSANEVNNYRLTSEKINSNNIGVNEMVSSAVYNRCLSTIIESLNSVLELIATRANTKEFYRNRTNILKKHPVPVVESYLPTGYRYRIQKFV